MFKKGLTGHQLKIIGLIFMVCDHIHQMFYYAGNLSWLTMMGRIALPIFLFTCAEAYYHTRSKKKYAFRLGLWAVGMRVFSLFAVQKLFPITAHDVELMNNIFATMAVSVVVMMALDAFRDKKIGQGLGLLFLPALPLLFLALFYVLNLIEVARIFAIFPSYLSVEGGPTAVALTVLFYVLRGKRLYQCLLILAMGLLNIFLNKQFGLTALFTGNLQWFMIFAIPFIALYNGQKGGGNKYFFYIFYPAHIYALYLLAYFLLKQGILS